MIDRKLKLSWRRRIRYSRRQVEDLSYQAEEQLERLFFRRLSRIVRVRRFVASWLLLFIFLIGITIIQTRSLSGYYQSLQPIAGGSFTEGIAGVFTNANPIYATGAVDSSVSKLLFGGLLKYDQNNNLVPDLASSWQSDVLGRNYTVILRDDIMWHDRVPITASDVVFTYQAIQNPDVKSPFFSSWQGIKVVALNKKTVRFTLPNTLSSFPYGLTNGLLPMHVLKDINPEQLRSATYNTVNTIGSGPFKWDAIQVIGKTVQDREERIGLVPNSDYYAGAPKLQHFIIRAFHNTKSLIASLQKNELNAVSGLDNVPSFVDKNTNFETLSVPLTAEVLVFFRTDGQILKDPLVRTALVRATNQSEILGSLSYSVISSREPFLPIHFAYDKSFFQFGSSVSAANKLLDKAGWKLDSSGDGIRKKNGRPLSFSLVSGPTTDYSVVAQKLQSQWRAVGVNLQVILESADGLQSRLANYDYDSLLYGISLGPDPDVFPFWDSSQANITADNALNFSKYKSAIADASLEAGRTRLNKELRKVKYRPFLEVWRNDAPAIALYQPRFLYVTHGTIYNLDPKYLNSASERYSNVNNWMIRVGKVDN